VGEKEILVAILFRSPVVKPHFLFPLPIVLFFKLLLNLYFGPSSFMLCNTEIQGIISSQMLAKKSLQRLEAGVL